MAHASLRSRVLDQLRRITLLYRLSRAAKRFMHRLLLTFFSILGGNNPRIGVARRKLRLSPLVLDGTVEGRIILGSQPLPPSPVGSLRHRTGWDLTPCQPWPIFWAHVTNAHLVGPSHGLLLAPKAIVLESVWGEYYCKWDSALNYFTLRPAERLEGNWTSLVSQYVNSFFHWFLDTLPRLACLDEFPTDTRILVPKPLARFQRESLEMLGLATHRLQETTKSHLCLEHYYFSSFTAMTGVSNPYAVAFLRTRFQRYFSDDEAAAVQVFVTRPGKTRGMHNETAVAEYFRRDGWLVVDLEQLPVTNQIKLFSSAQAIVAAHGAALTNLLWCRPGTKVLEVCADRFVNGCYETIAELLCLDYRHILLPSDHSFRVTLPLKVLESHRDWLNDGRKKVPIDRVLPYTNHGCRSTHD